MKTASVRELKSNPSAALRDAREGPVLILNRGLPEALLVSVGERPGGTDLGEEIREAVRVINGLAEGHGARAVRAVDRAARRRVAERPATYESAPAAEVSLAMLAATLQAVVQPQRIVRQRRAGEGEAETVIVIVDRQPARAELGRIEAAAAASGRRVVVRLADPRDQGAPEEEILFDRAAVPMRAIDRLLAEGRARPPRRSGAFPPRIAVEPGVSATSEVLRERAGDNR